MLAAWIVGRGLLLTGDQTLETDAVGQARLFSDYVPKLMFVLLPAFALLLKAAFRKRFYFDHLIHSLHLHSVAYIVLAMMLPLERAASESGPALVAQSVLFVYLLGSFIVSLRHVYRVGWLEAGGKAAGVLLAYVFLVAGSLEVASYFTMPDSASLPFLTD